MHFWLHRAVGHNPIQFGQVKQAYPDLEEAYTLARDGCISAFARWQGLLPKLQGWAEEGKLMQALEWQEAHHITMLPGCSQAYPALLKEIRNPPPVLYVRGRLKANPRLAIAMVGMRKHTPYGEGVARHLAGELARSGATVVSGMALGIDAAAAAGALAVEDAELPTVAVLGCGVDVVYPSANARLYDAIVERGAVISEFIPGTKPLREHFPIRNRVISGLAAGVVIVEAAMKSGSIITANHALDQNRDVFAVPGRITDETSFGPNGLIQRGEAKPVFCAADILVEYGLGPAKPKPAVQVDTTGLSQVECSIVEALMRGERSADELCEQLGLPVAQINSGLTSLQFSGIIKQLPGRVFGL